MYVRSVRGGGCVRNVCEVCVCKECAWRGVCVRSVHGGVCKECA